MNNNIKRAKQYIDCFNKENPNITYTCFGPTGPTGPTGPAGATITVGVTTTTDPGTNASVVNTGTPSNAILEFNIPAGATARCNKSSIYFFNGKVPYYFNIP